MNDFPCTADTARPGPIERLAALGRWAPAALILLMLVAISGIGRGDGPDEPRVGSRLVPCTILKVGKRYINVEKILYVEDWPGNKGLRVYFVDDRNSNLFLGGDEADAFRRWLDSVSTLPPGLKAGGALGTPATLEEPH